jgi:hypothetical protein
VILTRCFSKKSLKTILTIAKIIWTRPERDTTVLQQRGRIKC